MVPEGWLTLATVLKPRGNKGEVLVDLLTDDIERLIEASPVQVFESSSASKGFDVEEAWMHGDKAVVKLAGVGSIGEAEKLRGVDLCIPLASRREPKTGEVFLSDLIGCEIFDRSGLPLGTVENVYEEGAQVWLGVGSGDALIPWVPAFFPERDLSNRRLVAELPEGLLEVNRP